MTDLERKLIGILVEVKETEVAEEYSEDSKIIDDIGLDSLEMINFVLRVEDEFNVEINFDEFDFSYMEDIKTFANFIDNSCRLENKSGVSV